MYRAFPIACLMLCLLVPAARADDASRYEILVVPASAKPGDGNTETLLIDRQTGRTWMRITEFDPATFTAKDTYWTPLRFQVLPAEENKPFLPPN